MVFNQSSSADPIGYSFCEMMNKLSKVDQLVLQQMSEGVPDYQICREQKLTPESFLRSLARIEARADLAADCQDAGRLHERALRKRAERVNLSISTRLNALMDILPQAVLVIDGRTGAIKDFNEPACEMFGYSAQELRTLTVEDLVAESARSVHHAYRIGFLMNVRKRAMGYHPPISGVKKDGSTIDMAIGLTATVADDDIMVVCTGRVNWQEGQLAEGKANLA